MRKIVLGSIALAALMAGPAMAADLARPVYKAAPPPPPLFSWTGFYIGVHVGAGWGTKEEPLTLLGLAILNQNNYAINGFLGGGQVGFNYQVGPVVWGVEAQFSAADLDGRATCNVAVVALANCHTKADFLGTVAGRLGFASDRTLVFVKGGGAWVHDKYDIGSSIVPVVNALGISQVEETRWGWMVGTGVEYAFFGNWSAKVEYDFMDFGTKTVTFPSLIAIGVPAVNSVDIRERIHLVKFGLNYKFGYGPLSAAY